MDLKHATNLLGRYLDGDCSPEEKALVERWYEVLDERGEMPYNPEERKLFMVEMKAKALAEIGQEPVVQEVPVVKIGSRIKTVWWAAAAIVILFTSTLFLVNRNAGNQPETVKAGEKPDIKAPVTNRAMITLADGRVVYLDSVNNGQVISEGGAELVKLANGELQYTVDGSIENGAISRNTLFNPRGSQVISMILADGSKVWLNAGSSLTYPVAFAGGERRVEITGEAYFEVTHAPAAPFIVSCNQSEVEVLGTEFNVNANIAAIGTAVTLFRGSVRVENEGANRMIKPGQQAIIGTQIQVVDDVDLEAVGAWRNGIFSFNETSFDEMMQEIARWYDVEVVFSGKIPERRFGGKIHRTANLSEVLQILGESDVNYRLEGRQLIIVK